MKKGHLSFDKQKNFNPADIPVGILFTIVFIAIGLAVTINMRPLYYMNIESQNLEQTSGLNSVVIKENYDALIDYCSPFHFEELKFPSLRSSISGISHFAEVKVIFNVIYIAGAISLILCICIILLKRRSGDRRYLLVSGITVLVLPVVLAIASLINFDAFFTLFHKVVFNNDDWLFDPATDPIIDLLPETYFMQCALLIAAIVILGAAALLISYFVLKHRGRSAGYLPKKKNYYYR